MTESPSPHAQPAWLSRRAIPQALVIVALVAGTVAYLPVGRSSTIAAAGSSALRAQEQTVTVIVNGETKTVRTSSLTVGHLLDELGYAGHAVPNVPEDTSLDRLTGPLVVDLAREVTIVSGNKSFQVFTRVATVRELLERTGLDLNEPLAAVNGVLPSSLIHDGMIIYVQKLQLPLTVKEDEQIPYMSEQYVDPNMASGTRRVMRAGSPGQRVRVYRVEASKDGSLQRVLVSTTISRRPVAEQVAIGPVQSGGTHPTLAESHSSYPTLQAGSVPPSSAPSVSPSPFYTPWAQPAPAAPQPAWTPAPAPLPTLPAPVGTPQVPSPTQTPPTTPPSRPTTDPTTPPATQSPEPSREPTPSPSSLQPTPTTAPSSEPSRSPSESGSGASPSSTGTPSADPRLSSLPNTGTESGSTQATAEAAEPSP
ncbi:G5 domain-containing protein [Falsarthrobacter nasiphocae]|uniref:Uncharacterized protein YabE (DUF348 family) n=1 Tax=Falsarthrobacter nasiphocae TaxID=189863 RepID=A0AAE3YGK1_9MICC|nr:G5 domain-containing protein [Falsarthrobacter nasiphocae]MDR6891611.1 uncharacterized protein YabE (DUF348 family) [Falsarthrobacter nasiphocae]